MSKEVDALILKFAEDTDNQLAYKSDTPRFFEYQFRMFYKELRALRFGLIIALSVVVVGMSLKPLWINYNNPCVRTERRMVHYEAWTQLIKVGNSLIPIFHPAHDSMEDVCVERRSR